jgi:hypothetical protein
LIHRDQVVDVGGGEALLGRVSKPSRFFSSPHGAIVGGSNLGGFGVLAKVVDPL